MYCSLQGLIHFGEGRRRTAALLAQASGLVFFLLVLLSRDVFLAVPLEDAPVGYMWCYANRFVN